MSSFVLAFSLRSCFLPESGAAYFEVEHSRFFGLGFSVFF